MHVPEGEPLLELRMHPSKLDLPVLRTVTRHGGLSDRMLDDSAFRYCTQRVVRNAGYWGELTIHAIRRAVANVGDGKTLSLVLTFPPDLRWLTRLSSLDLNRESHSRGAK